MSRYIHIKTGISGWREYIKSEFEVQKKNVVVHLELEVYLSEFLW
jgi:hypothetical protein